MLVGMGLLGKRVHLAQYLAHISPSISPNPPGTKTSRGVRWGLPLSQHICVYKQRPLQFTWPPRQGAICRVHVFKRSCSHFSQVCHAEVCPAQSLKDRNARTQTPTKAKRKLTIVFCGLSLLLAEIGSRCAMGHGYNVGFAPVMWDW